MKVIKKDEIQYMPYDSEFYSIIEADEKIENLRKLCHQLSAALHKMYSEEEVKELRDKITSLKNGTIDLIIEIGDLKYKISTGVPSNTEESRDLSKLDKDSNNTIESSVDELDLYGWNDGTSGGTMSELKKPAVLQLRHNNSEGFVYAYEVDEMDTYLSEVAALLSEKDKEIANLKSDIADLRDDKKSTDASLDERNAEVAKLQATIAEKDKVIKNCKKRLQGSLRPLADCHPHQRRADG